MNEGAYLVINDAPEGLDFGIDVMNYGIGPKFLGVSQIPAGLHFVYHSCGMGSKQGFFEWFHKDDLLIRSWDPKNEEISLKPLLSDGSVSALEQSVRHGRVLDRMGPYPHEHRHTWTNLSNMITLDVLQRADVAPGVLVYAGDASDLDLDLGGGGGGPRQRKQQRQKREARVSRSVKKRAMHSSHLHAHPC